ncbi:MAG: DUF3488 and transglutaminase-like domain-containing protein [Candidatus Melainabacteria bacterium]|nr:DUF3488 and transglutaminase-like domain-containing protein [Candidatus Melainabacteria bacterium]
MTTGKNDDKGGIKDPAAKPADEAATTPGPANGGGYGQPDAGEDAFEKTVISRPTNIPRTPERAPGATIRQVGGIGDLARPALVVKPGPEALRGTAKEAVPVKPESSIPLRLATLSMVVILITGASIYMSTPGLITFLLTWLAMIGTLISYLTREKRPMWVNIIPGVGALALLTYFFIDCAAQFNLGQFNLLSSIAKVLGGLLALHCFDLRTRADFSASALIGLGLLVCTAGAANDFFFFIFILGYMTCLSLILYFDGVSRSRDVGPSRPIGEGRPASLPKPTKRQTRATTSIMLIPVISLPLMTILMFFCMPRSNSLIEWVLENGVRPYVAVSQADRARGITPGTGSTNQGSSTGSSTTDGANGQGGAGGSGNPQSAVNPLDKRTSGKGPKGVGGGKPSDNPFKEGVTNKPETPQDALLPAELSDNVVMRIASPRTGYMRRLAFDTYDGKTWTRSGPLKEVQFDLQDNEFPVANANAYAIPKDCPVAEVKQEITLDMPLAGGSLPAMWVPQQVAGPFTSMSVEADGTLKPQGVIEPGTSYVVKSFLPIYRPAVMRSLPQKTHSDFRASLLLPPVAEMEAAEQEVMDKYLQLPDSLPSRVRKQATKIAGADGNSFVKAERIAAFFHKKQFKYKTKNIYRVQGGDFVDNFMHNTKEGNCVDFASSFVIVCRAAGIPARLVGGYLPGSFNKKTGFQEIKVKDGHTWAEIYVPNWSWVPFDPSPNGQLPEFQKDGGFLSKLADMGFANPFGGAFMGNRGTPGGGIGNGISGSRMEKQLAQEKRKREGKAPVEEEEEGFDIMKRLAKIRWEPIAIFCILTTAVAVGVMLMQRKRTQDAIGIPLDARKSTLLFFQVVRDLRKYKIVRLQTDTPLELAARIQEGFEIHREEGKFVHPDLEPLLSNFLEVYTLDRFGRSESRIEELENMSEKIKKLVSLNK